MIVVRWLDTPFSCILRNLRHHERYHALGPVGHRPANRAWLYSRIVAFLYYFGCSGFRSEFDIVRVLHFLSTISTIMIDELRTREILIMSLHSALDLTITFRQSNDLHIAFHAQYFNSLERFIMFSWVYVRTL